MVAFTLEVLKVVASLTVNTYTRKGHPCYIVLKCMQTIFSCYISSQYFFFKFLGTWNLFIGSKYFWLLGIPLYLLKPFWWNLLYPVVIKTNQKDFRSTFNFKADLRGADVAAATFESTAACLKSCTQNHCQIQCICILTWKHLPLWTKFRLFLSS